MSETSPTFILIPNNPNCECYGNKLTTSGTVGDQNQIAWCKGKAENCMGIFLHINQARKYQSFLWTWNITDVVVKKGGGGGGWRVAVGGSEDNICKYEMKESDQYGINQGI